MGIPKGSPWIPGILQEPHTGRSAVGSRGKALEVLLGSWGGTWRYLRAFSGRSQDIEGSSRGHLKVI